MLRELTSKRKRTGRRSSSVAGWEARLFLGFLLAGLCYPVAFRLCATRACAIDASLDHVFQNRGELMRDEHPGSRHCQTTIGRQQPRGNKRC